MSKEIILGSQSPHRLQLLKTIGLNVETIMPADIDESELPKEHPKAAAMRLARLKAEKILETCAPNKLIITADSIAAPGKFILPKALTDEDVEFCLKKISGRKINIYTGVTIASSDSKEIKTKLAHSIVNCKKLSRSEIDWYISTKEGINKAGGFSISGAFQVFCKSIKGQVSTIVGLPLYELKNMLESFGYKFEGKK